MIMHMTIKHMYTEIIPTPMKIISVKLVLMLIRITVMTTVTIRTLMNINMKVMMKRIMHMITRTMRMIMNISMDTAGTLERLQMRTMRLSGGRILYQPHSSQSVLAN
jgi:hypothetical protein